MTVWFYAMTPRSEAQIYMELSCRARGNVLLMVPRASGSGGKVMLVTLVAGAVENVTP
jgi:hypothetical protein